MHDTEKKHRSPTRLQILVAILAGVALLSGVLFWISRESFYGPPPLSEEAADTLRMTVFKGTVDYYAEVCPAISGALKIPDALSIAHEETIGMEPRDAASRRAEAASGQASVMHRYSETLASLPDPQGVRAFDVVGDVSYDGAAQPLASTLGTISEGLDKVAKRYQRVKTDEGITRVSQAQDALLNKTMPRISTDVKTLTTKAIITSDATFEVVKKQLGCAQVFSNKKQPPEKKIITPAVEFYVAVDKATIVLRDHTDLLRKLGDNKQKVTAEQAKELLTAAWERRLKGATQAKKIITSWKLPDNLPREEQDVLSGYPEAKNQAVKTYEAVRKQASSVVSQLRKSQSMEDLDAIIESSKDSLNEVMIKESKFITRLSRIAKIPNNVTGDEISRLTDR